MTITIVGDATVYNFVESGKVSEEPVRIHIQGINISIFVLPFPNVPMIKEFHVFSIVNMDSVLLKAQNGTQVLPFPNIPMIKEFHVFSIVNVDAVLLKAQKGTQVLVLRSKECICTYKLHYEV